MAPPKTDPIERIMNKIERQGDCWIFKGSKTRDGYGVIGVGRRQKRVHRLMFERFVGPIFDNKLVCHTCDNPICCNPRHLFAGTNSDNMRDREAKGRSNVPTGENHWNYKLSDTDKAQIVELRNAGLKLNEISAKFNISFQHVSFVCKNYGRASNG